jgi:predicted transcriptional regulator
MTETFTESLRRRLLEASKFCPTCHQPTASVPQLAERMAVPYPTLNRFLNGGTPNAATIDAIVKYLGEGA